MNFTQIEELVAKTDWVNVDGTSDYYAKDDIFLGFHFDGWHNLTKTELVENVSPFHNILTQKVNVHQIQICNVKYEYSNRNIYSVNLYNFVIEDRDSDGKDVVNVFYAKPEKVHHMSQVTDIFYLALLKKLNSARALELIAYASGQQF